MKKLLLVFLFIFLTFNSYNQKYTQKILFHDYGVWKIDMPNNNKIAVRAFVTRQNIITYDNYALMQKTVSNIPKYRYELMLESKSIYNGKSTSTWLYNTRIYINDVETTEKQFPDGFTTSIAITPTLIYWYETSVTTINFKVVWATSTYEPRNN